MIKHVFKKGVHTPAETLTFLGFLEGPDRFATFVTSQQRLTVVTVRLVEETHFYSLSPRTMLPASSASLYAWQVNRCLCPRFEVSGRSLR